MIKINFVAFAMLAPGPSAFARKQIHHLFPEKKLAKSGKPKSTTMNSTKSAKMLTSKSTKISKSAKCILDETNTPTISRVSSPRVDPDDIFLRPVGNKTYVEPSVSPTSINFIHSTLPNFEVLFTHHPSVAPSSNPTSAHPDPSNGISPSHHDSSPPSSYSPSSQSIIFSNVPSTFYSYPNSNEPSLSQSSSPSSLPSRAQPTRNMPPGELFGNPVTEENSLAPSNMPNISSSYNDSQSEPTGSHESTVPPSQSYENSFAQNVSFSIPTNIPSKSPSKEESPKKHHSEIISPRPSQTPSERAISSETISPRRETSFTPSASPMTGVYDGVITSGPKIQCKNPDFKLSNERTIQLPFFYRAETKDSNDIEFLQDVEQSLLELVAERVLVCDGIFQRNLLSRWQVAAVISKPEDVLSSEHTCFPTHVDAESCHVVEGKMSFVIGSLNITGIASIDSELYAAIKAAFKSLKFDDYHVIYLGEQLSTLTMFDINSNKNAEVKKDSGILKTVLISTFSFLAVIALLILSFSRYQTKKFHPEHENGDVHRDNGNELSSVCAETGAAAPGEV